MEAHMRAGPVTDYTSSMVQWMRHRQPRYKGGARLEMERPSPSYIVDVCSFKQENIHFDGPLLIRMPALDATSSRKAS